MSGFVWVLGGTSEGRYFCNLLSKQKILTVVTVASEYGGELVSSLPNIEVRTGKLDEKQMEDMLREGVCCAVDATHPYAQNVSRNARQACAQVNVPYIRIAREGSDLIGNDIIRVKDAVSATRYLSEHDGNALLATGVNSLQFFTTVPNHADRLTARVLPDVQSIQKCLDAGWNADRIIAMKGPFSYELNCAMLRNIDAAYMVSKDGGKAGGMQEKIRAVRHCGAKLILIERPEDVQGVNVDSAFKQVCTYMAHIPDQNMIDFLQKPQAQESQKKGENAYPRVPLFVNISGAKVVIVGGGKIAARRARSLDKFGADIYVIAPLINTDMPEVSWIQREYQEGDTEGAAIVLAATNSKQVNAIVTNEAKSNGIPVSCADDPEAGTFHFPAVYTRGTLSVGMVSGDPSTTRHIASHLRRYLDQALTGNGYEDLND